MDELLEQFLLEGRDLVAQAHRDLVTLGGAPGDGAARDSLFRALHTLKGSVALFDMAPAESLLHAAEARIEAFRHDGRPLDDALLDTLVAIVDRVDGWIDAMEREQTLGPSAPADAQRLAVQLRAEAPEPERAPAKLPQAREPEWVGRMRTRPGFAHDAITAFRYIPDAECFFRGEDPLALAAQVPALAALAIVPADDGWPALETFDPFRCVAILEGASGAGPDAVASVFRLVRDQVEIVALVPAAPSPASAPPERAAAATIRVDAVKLDRLASRSGDLGVAARALKPLVDGLRALDPARAAELRAVQDAIERVATDIVRAVAEVRLVSLEPVLRRLPRLAREAAAELDKSVRLTLAGERTEVDKQIAEALFEPLLHLVRNAVDHGIEPAAARAAAGKPIDGRIDLSVRIEGERVAITLADDGRGMDPAALRKAAVEKGMVSADAAAALSDADALRLVFLAGFSTASAVTGISGRGVGMDAVKAAVDRLQGTIAIDSAPGTGTRIVLWLPANAITTPLLVVSAGGEQFGIRFDQLVETVRIPAVSIQRAGYGLACVLRETTVPVLDLATLLRLPAPTGDHARMVVTRAGGTLTALRVEGFGERIEAVVRAPVGLLATMPAIGGTTTLPDGTVLLVLNLAEVLQ